MPVERVSSFRGLGIAGISATRVQKKLGDQISVTLTFEHLGKGGSFDVGIGLAPAALVGFQNVTHWFYVVASYADSTSWTQRTVNVVATLPTTLALGLKDALKFIQTKDGFRDAGGNGFLVAEWDQDVYDVVSGVSEAQFRNLSASYA